MFLLLSRLPLPLHPSFVVMPAMQAIWHVSTTHAHTPWIMDIWADLTFQYWTYRIVLCNISSHFNCKVWLADKCKLRLAGKDRYVLCLLLKWWQVFQLVWYNETVHVWRLRLYSLCYTPCVYTPCGDCNKIWSPWHKRQDGRIVTRKRLCLNVRLRNALFDITKYMSSTGIIKNFGWLWAILWT